MAATKAMPAGALALMLSACASDPVRESAASIGIPDPAAVFCENRGGSYDPATGDCTLADGTTVDAWDYFRGEYGG